MERPTKITPGSYTDLALADLDKAIATSDDAAIARAFQRIMTVTPFVANDPRECARYEEVASYVEAVLEAHYG